MKNQLTLLLAAATALLALPAQAQTDEAALLRCSQTSENTVRLACYDALAAQAAQTRTRAAVAPASDPRKVDDFGRPPKVGASDIDVLESRINGRFEGWRARQRFTLANGQIWEVSDDSSGFADLQDPVVRIHRAAMGSFMLEIQGLARAPRVKRVQ